MTPTGKQGNSDGDNNQCGKPGTRVDEETRMTPQESGKELLGAGLGRGCATVIVIRRPLHVVSILDTHMITLVAVQQPNFD